MHGNRGKRELREIERFRFVCVEMLHASVVG
jgi:hypothetical protein